MGEGRRVIMDADGIARALSRIAAEILEHNRGTSDLCLVGVRRGGVPLAVRLQRLLLEHEPRSSSRAVERTGPIPLGALDITLYRDDSSTSPPNPRIGRSDIPFALERHTVVLVDDVVFTGRTTRAAIDALLDYGRPRGIQLAALVDRGHRELPIQPDYVGAVVSTQREELVEVLLERSGQSDEVVVMSPRDAEGVGPEGGGS